MREAASQMDLICKLGINFFIFAYKVSRRARPRLAFLGQESLGAARLKYRKNDNVNALAKLVGRFF